IDVSRDAKELGARVVLAAKPREPRRAAPQDFRDDGDGFDVVDGGGATVKAHTGREWGLQTRLALLAFEGFEQRGFLAADIGPCPMVDDDIEIPAMDVVLANQASVISLLHGGFEPVTLAYELAAHINEGLVRIHGAARDQASFDKMVRVVAQDFPVLAGAGLGFVGIDDEVVRAAVIDLGHEAPFQPGREPRAAATAQARGLDLVGQPFAALVEQILGAAPGAATARAFEAPIV